MEENAEPARRRKFLVVVDSTPESAVAMRFAARRAVRTGGGLVLLYVIEPASFSHWLGVGEVMRQEAREEAERQLQSLADALHELGDFPTELSIREGVRHEQVLAELRADKGIRILVLASAVGSEGPGPLVSMMAGTASSTLPVPLTIVPGSMTDAQIDEVC